MINVSQSLVLLLSVMYYLVFFYKKCDVLCLFGSYGRGRGCTSLQNKAQYLSKIKRIIYIIFLFV